MLPPVPTFFRASRRYGVRMRRTRGVRLKRRYGVGMRRTRSVRLKRRYP